MSSDVPAGLFSMTVLVIVGRLDSCDIPSLCARGRALASAAGDVFVYCDVAGVTRPDAVLIDALAQLQLTLKPLGCELRLLHAAEELKELIDLVGLGDAVLCAESVVETRGESEQRKHPLGVEEEADPTDRSV